MQATYKYANYKQSTHKYVTSMRFNKVEFRTLPDSIIIGHPEKKVIP